MQQVVVLHGGDVYGTYEEYLQSLRDKEVSLERLRHKDWKSNLQEELGDAFDVITPRLPNSANARYLEWKILFEKIVSLLSDNVIFIGHSLGGIFLAKYLAENKYPRPIRATLLIAAPYNTPQHNELADFTLPERLETFGSQGGKILLYHSKDDPVVPFSDGAKYQKKLPGAQLRPFTDRGHFNDEKFPEIVRDIKALE